MADLQQKDWTKLLFEDNNSVVLDVRTLDEVEELGIIPEALNIDIFKGQGFIDEIGVELDARGNVGANETDYETSVNKVFVAGDARRGQSLVVWAISEGRECARKVDEYLMGYSSLESKDKSYINNI